MLVDITLVSRETMPIKYPHLSLEKMEELAPLVLRYLPVRVSEGIYESASFDMQTYVMEPLERFSMRGHPRQLTRYERLLPESDQQDIRDKIWEQHHIERKRGLRTMRRLYSQRYHRNWNEWTDQEPEFGVADVPEQVLARYPHIVDDDIRRVLSYTPVYREHQDETMGWRYHKWGPYIGKQRPKHEYLYDDKHIDRVICWHLYRLI